VTDLLTRSSSVNTHVYLNMIYRLLEENVAISLAGEVDWLALWEGERERFREMAREIAQGVSLDQIDPEG